MNQKLANLLNSVVVIITRFDKCSFVAYYAFNKWDRSGANFRKVHEKLPSGYHYTYRTIQEAIQDIVAADKTTPLFKRMPDGRVLRIPR